MSKEINSILIVGGGSAGWMTAAMLIKAFPYRKISLIESPSISTVGVGESTLGEINDFLDFLEIDEKDFMKSTNASYKMSIKFTDFYEKNSGGFHYPFGKPFTDGTNQGIRDWMFKKSIYPNIPVQDFVRSYFPSSALFEQNKYDENKNGKFDNFNPKRDVAYHFDASLFGLWLREKYCIPKGVKYIVGNVNEVIMEEDGVKEIVLSDKTRLSSDLFIDCTGFNSLILDKHMKEPFISYDNLIPNDSAWATRLLYKDKEKELEPFTNCVAIENGWVWNIPLWSRIGTGYVYSSKHINDEDALEQFKKYLMSEKMIIKRNYEDIEQLDFKNIKMRIGIHERTFVKNVVAIGLSAGFIEPLESNGLFSVHSFLFKLLKALQRKSINQWDRDTYNNSTFELFNNFAQFVALHYSLSCRNDTKYWQENTERSYLSILKSEPLSDMYSFANAKQETGFLKENAGINYISVGMNYPILDNIMQKRGEIHDGVIHAEVLDSFFNNLEKNKNKWKKNSEKCHSLYEYLKNNVHTENNG